MTTADQLADSDLLGYTEIADLNNVIPKTIMNYHSSAKLKGYPSNMMPPPDDVSYGEHPRWRWDTIRDWMQRRPGLGSPVYRFSEEETKKIRMLRNSGASRQAIAEEFKVNPQVIARVLGEVRVPRSTEPLDAKTIAALQVARDRGASIAGLCREYGMSRERVRRALGELV